MPCGTPESTGQGSKSAPSTRTHWERPCRKDADQFEHLKKEGRVVDFVKSFREVQEDSVYLPRVVKTVRKVKESID